MLTAVAEIVFQVVAFRLEDIVILVFDLPTGTPIPHNGFDSRFFHPKIRAERIFVKLFARVFTRGGQFAPVHRDRRLVTP